MEGIFESLFIFLLIIVNGIFSMSEIALVSVRKARLQQMAEDGKSQAKAALELASSPNRLLPTVQIGITLVGILSGALGGQSLAVRLDEYLRINFPFLGTYTHGISLTLVVLLITYFSLVVGELIPKRLALLWTERIALQAAFPMLFISNLFTPLVHFLGKSTDVGLRLFGAKENLESSVSDEEIKILMQQGTDVGIFEESEQDMVEGIFRLSDRVISGIMTPRTEIVFLDLDAPLSENLEIIRKYPYIRFPAAHHDLDHVQGIVHLRDILMAKLDKKVLNLNDVLQNPLFLPESTPALRALEHLKENRTDTALVIDEYGGLLGMVTLNDIFKSIAGDFPAAGEDTSPAIFHRPDGSWLLDGMLNIDELKILLNIDELPDEERIGYQTVGGFVMYMLNAVPNVGQFFIFQQYQIEVVDMDGKRVDKVLVELEK